MWLSVNDLRSRALGGPHVNSPVAGFRTQVAELTAVSLLPPELEVPVLGRYFKTDDRGKNEAFYKPRVLCFGCRVKLKINNVKQRCVCMGCSLSKKKKKNAIRPPGYEAPDVLASVTPC